MIISIGHTLRITCHTFNIVHDDHYVIFTYDNEMIHVGYVETCFISRVNNMFQIDITIHEP